MTDHDKERARRETAARQAIKNGFNMEDEESGVAMFVAFHLEELPADYWQQQLNTTRPDPSAVLDILELHGHWGEDNELEYFDFTLPGEVTDYVISVHFDAKGKIIEISMES
jgi:hypothetical protein